MDRQSECGPETISTRGPYKGAGPALNDLMGGQVDLLCDQTTQTAPAIKDGNRVKVYGVTALKRRCLRPEEHTGGDNEQAEHRAARRLAG